MFKKLILCSLILMFPGLHAMQSIDDQLLNAVEGGDLDLVKDLISRNANVNVLSLNESGTPLSRAALVGDPKIVRYLLEHGAQVDLANKSDVTPLMNAAAAILPSKDTYVDVIEILLEYNANIHAKNKIGETPLITASRRGKAQIVKLLLDRGAQVNSYNNDGDTALIEASKRDEFEAADLLLKYNANTEI